MHHAPRLSRVALAISFGVDQSCIAPQRSSSVLKSSQTEGGERYCRMLRALEYPSR